jgi:hypothetical protein
LSLLKSKLAFLSVLLAFAAFAAEASPVEKPKDSEKVPVELEWEQIAGAKMYELEFQNLAGQKLVTFHSPSHVFKFKMKVGQYQVRSRVADERQVYGVWSTPTAFKVEPKPPIVGENASRTNGKLDPKTLTAEVNYQWGAAPGAEQFKLIILDSSGAVVHEEVTSETHCKAQLPAGEYTATLASLGADGVNSAAIPLPGQVLIRSARLLPPELIFETKDGHMFSREGVPMLKWKTRFRSVVSGDLEYSFFFGEEWIPVQAFKELKTQEVVLEKARKPGRYRISLWAESPGLIKSSATVYEFVVKPKVY